MNIPMGMQEIAGKELSEEATGDIISFMDAGKTGYFCITTEGKSGIEDGLLVVELGSVIGAHYEYLAFGKEYVAGEALKRVLNSLLAEKGIYDSYTLTSQQLELLKIFNENLLLLEKIPLRSLEGLIPPAFSPQFESQELAAKPQAREDILQKHGLTEIKVDDYAEIKAQLNSAVEHPSSAAKVAGEVDRYLNAPAEKPKAQPAASPPVASQAEPLEDLEKLNAQAEKLRKLLLKGK